MSAIATFELLPTASINELRAAAELKPTRGGGAFADFMKAHAREVASYPWSGWVMATLLPYLEEKHGIDLMNSAYDDLSTHLSATQGSTYFVLTNDHRRDYLAKLDPTAFQVSELRDYYNMFTASNEPNAGKPMLDGIKALSEALGHVDKTSIVMLGVG